MAQDPWSQALRHVGWGYIRLFQGDVTGGRGRVRHRHRGVPRHRRPLGPGRAPRRPRPHHGLARRRRAVGRAGRRGLRARTAARRGRGHGRPAVPACRGNGPRGPWLAEVEGDADAAGARCREAPAAGAGDPRTAAGVPSAWPGWRCATTTADARPCCWAREGRCGGCRSPGTRTSRGSPDGRGSRWETWRTRRRTSAGRRCPARRRRRSSARRPGIGAGRRVTLATALVGASHRRRRGAAPRPSGAARVCRQPLLMCL
jgi:hypothetical protein